MDIFSVLVAAILLLASLILLYVTCESKDYPVFRRLGIPALSPWPGVGNFLEIAKIGLFEFHQKYYNKFSTEKVYGYFEPGVTLMAVRDLDMIRDIMIKNFNSFVNRRQFVTNEKPFGSMLNALEGEHWRYVRNTISPTFSSGNLRQMCLLIEQSAKDLVSNMREFSQNEQEIELKDVLSCYTMDVIASTGFGVKIDSLKNRSSLFVQEAKNIMNISSRTVAIAFLFPSLVKLLNKLGIGIFPKRSVDFICSFVDAAKKNKTDGGEAHLKRRDFLQLIINEQNRQKVSNSESNNKQEQQLKGLSDDEILGQGMIFIIAGYDTVASVLSFALFTLANHPEICSKLQEELSCVLQGQFPSSETVQNLPYMDMCLNEVLRMYPPGFITDRVCTEDCIVEGVKIPKGMVIIIPVFAIHKDPKYFPNPENFDPERFSPENKATRHPFAHLPFGQGPRHCIGMRLALMEIKIALAVILQEVSLVPCKKTVYPPRMSKYQLKAEDELWVKVLARKGVQKEASIEDG